MDRISYSEFSKIGKEGLKRIMPVLITFDGEPLGIFCGLKGFIVIEDLHPRVQNQLKAKEKLARGGMKGGEKVYSDMFKEAEKPVID